jgi:hypothetical protein
MALALLRVYEGGVDSLKIPQCLSKLVRLHIGFIAQHLDFRHTKGLKHMFAFFASTMTGGISFVGCTGRYLST